MAREFYVTFGLKYQHEPHPTLPEAHPDGWMVVEANDEAHARARAFVAIGTHWAFIYPAEHFQPEYFPLGEIARLAFEAGAR